MVTVKSKELTLISDTVLEDIINREQVEARKVHMFYEVVNIGNWL